MVFFFFQAEDGIRDGHVTGVQTCALPIYTGLEVDMEQRMISMNSEQPDSSSYYPFYEFRRQDGFNTFMKHQSFFPRSEERRVGKECRSRRATAHEQTRRSKHGERQRRDDK